MGKLHVTMKVGIPDVYVMAKRLGVDKDGDVQEKLTDEVARNLPDYMPEQTGKLKGSLRKVTPTLIKVSGVQARFLFFGVTKSGKSVEYSRDKNPNAGPNWDRRMLADRRAAIAAAVQKYIDGRGRR